MAPEAQSKGGGAASIMTEDVSWRWRLNWALPLRASAGPGWGRSGPGGVGLGLSLRLSCLWGYYLLRLQLGSCCREHSWREAAHFLLRCTLQAKWSLFGKSLGLHMDPLYQWVYLIFCFCFFCAAGSRLRQSRACAGPSPGCLSSVMK